MVGSSADILAGHQSPAHTICTLQDHSDHKTQNHPDPNISPSHRDEMVQRCEGRLLALVTVGYCWLLLVAQPEVFSLLMKHPRNYC